MLSNLEEFQKSYERLNVSQKEAVDIIEGPVLVVAGPGTGKTQLLAMRAANILLTTDVIPSSILCLTFTDSAAQNMRARLSRLIGPVSQKIAVHTFHSFGTEVINQNPEYFFRGADYQPADDLAKISILNQIFEQMEWSNPLKKNHPSQGWTYLKDIQDRIRDLKQAGINPENFESILNDNNEILSVAGDMFQKVFDIPRITNLKQESWNEFAAGIESLYSDKTRVLHGQNDDLMKKKSKKLNYISWLERFYGDVQKISNNLDFTKKNNISQVKEFRDYWGKQDESKKWRLQDQLNFDKHKALAQVYTKYQENLHEKGLFDFEDMLLEVVEAFKTYPDLRYSYQEKYLYVMVDEFQDTNGVQMSLIDLLLDFDLSEGMPNILAVGDDDQAIYKFQKATIENIINFKDKYRDVKIVTLIDNYRSNQEILDFARDIIEQSETRLVNLVGISKNLISRK